MMIKIELNPDRSALSLLPPARRFARTAEMEHVVDSMIASELPAGQIHVNLIIDFAEAFRRLGTAAAQARNAMGGLGTTTAMLGGPNIGGTYAINERNFA